MNFTQRSATRFLLAGLLLAGLLPASQAQAQPETFTIAAANSVKDALRKVLPLFEAQHPEINVRVIYGPSQTLRKQIEEGAPVDVFLPSLFEEIDQLEKKGLVIQGTKRVYAGTSLVLITGVAIRFYQTLGFIVTMSLLVFALLVLVERKNVFAAAAYGLFLTGLAWWVFGKALKAPLETGILGF